MEKTYDTIINIQNEASVKAEGKHAHGCSIPVVCIEDGRSFVSIIDAAEAAGTHPNYMSKRLREDEMPNIKGKRYCYLTRLMESSDMVLTNLRENAENKEKARKWDEYQAEQERLRKEEEARLEAERKAKEEYEAKKQKLEDKILRRRKVSDRMKQGWDNAIARQMEAEKEYEALTGHTFDSEETA